MNPLLCARHCLGVFSPAFIRTAVLPRQLVFAAILLQITPSFAAALNLAWTNNMLTVSGGLLREPVQIWYLEAYCRPGSTDQSWDKTVIGHTAELLAADPEGKQIRLRDTLKDGVLVEHTITAAGDEVDFRLEAFNPTTKASLAHWAQPCMRVDRFAGAPRDDFHARVPEYAKKCFIFLDGRIARMPTMPWARNAIYTPGQVWAGPGVNRADVNPRPLSSLTPSNGLIGCYSADETVVLATAWKPWQELFQGIIGCIHSDFRIGGLEPGERKVIRGKLYVVPADIPALLARYERDFRD